MDKFVTLPAELLTLIVGHLRDRRIDPFDPVATKDLQSVRLVSRMMRAIATPMLFENMVYDLKFYTEQHIKRLTDFARINPELVGHVRRVQVRIPPKTVISAWDPRSDTARRFGLGGADTWTITQFKMACEARVPASRAWCSRMKLEKKKISENTSESREFSLVLPNLHHLEHRLSTYWQQEIVNTDQTLLTEHGIDIQSLLGVSNPDESRALEQGTKIVLNSVTGVIKSLKLLNVWIWDRHMIPVNLLHLDLEIRVFYTHDTLPDFQHVLFWRHGLQDVKQLKSLRLGFFDGGSRSTEYEEGYPGGFYIDDLLMSLDNATDDCFFPRLKSLELFDCPLRIQGLLGIAKRHQQTLRRLILSRTTLFPTYSAQNWCQIPEMCRDAAPGLTYLRLTKIVTSPPKHFNNAGVGAEPTPNGWTSGLEDAMTYEWTKGGIDGAGQEFIGSKCPWTCDENPDALDNDAVSARSGWNAGTGLKERPRRH